MQECLSFNSPNEMSRSVNRDELNWHRIKQFTASREFTLVMHSILHNACWKVSSNGNF